MTCSSSIMPTNVLMGKIYRPTSNIWGKYESEEKSPSTIEKFQFSPLIVWIDSIDNYHFHEEDITQVFSRYGKLSSVEMLNEGNCALVQFSFPESARDAIKNLDGRDLKGAIGKLCVRSFNQISLDEFNEDFNDFNTLKSVKKFTIRYDVQIEPDNGFDVAKRIIGLKGINMKRIHQLTKSKLRLRGIGSGYLEGHNRKEAPELLHLCISCQDHDKYLHARQLVEELLYKIYKEFDSWRLDNGLTPFNLKPKCHETLIQLPLSNLPSRLTSQDYNPSQNETVLDDQNDFSGEFYNNLATTNEKVYNSNFTPYENSGFTNYPTPLQSYGSSHLESPWVKEEQDQRSNSPPINQNFDYQKSLSLLNHIISNPNSKIDDNPKDLQALASLIDNLRSIYSSSVSSSGLANKRELDYNSINTNSTSSTIKDYPKIKANGTNQPVFSSTPHDEFGSFGMLFNQFKEGGAKDLNMQNNIKFSNDLNTSKSSPQLHSPGSENFFQKNLDVHTSNSFKSTSFPY